MVERRTAGALVCMLLVVTTVTAAAPAGATDPSRKTSIWGPVQMNGVSQFPLYRELGVGILQMSVGWSTTAPTRPQNPTDPADPAYRWPPEIDVAIAAGARRGISVSILLNGAPGWANGGRDATHAPRRPKDFADFAAAAARRYPAVRHWMIWGEPSKMSRFQPLVPAMGRRLRAA